MGLDNGWNISDAGQIIEAPPLPKKKKKKRKRDATRLEGLKLQKKKKKKRIAGAGNENLPVVSSIGTLITNRSDRANQLPITRFNCMSFPHQSHHESASGSGQKSPLISFEARNRATNKKKKKKKKKKRKKRKEEEAGDGKKNQKKKCDMKRNAARLIID